MSALVPHTSHRTERMLETTFFERGAIPKRHAQRRAQRTTIGHTRRARGMVIPPYPEIVPHRTGVRQPTTPLVRYIRPSAFGGLGVQKTSATLVATTPQPQRSLRYFDRMFAINSRTTMRTRFAWLPLVPLSSALGAQVSPVAAPLPPAPVTILTD